MTLDFNNAMFIDTHAHLSASAFDADRSDVLLRAWQHNISHIILIGSGYGLEGNKKTVALAKEDARLFAAVGAHPHEAMHVDDDWMAYCRMIASDPNIVAIGEIGLDYHYMHSSKDSQKKIFQDMVMLAHDVNKPIIIHDRDANCDIWECLDKTGIPKQGGVFHCFSGNLDMAMHAIAAGLYISIPGIVTFKNAYELWEVVANCPLEKMLIETDAPYLAPAPKRGVRNEPGYIIHTAEKIAELKGLNINDVARMTSQNAMQLFHLPGKEKWPEIAYQLDNSLYLNITNACNLHCSFCLKLIDYTIDGHYLKLDKEPSVEDVLQAIGSSFPYEEVVFCGFGEPTKRLEVIKAIASHMKEMGVKRIRLNTDGLGNKLHCRNILPELSGLIDCISISLNAPDADTYATLCPSMYHKDAFNEVCEFIVEAKKYIPTVKASVIDMPGQDIKACQLKAKALGVPLRIRTYMPIHK